MNILYGIQATGHGHISRAKELLPEFCKHANVDVLISGYACQLELEHDITYRKRGISLRYDSSGGVAVLETLRRFKLIRFISDIQSLSMQKYDLVISDYEPVSSWAARIAGVPSISMSHQAAFLSPQTPRPVKKSLIAEQLLQRFAPTDDVIGFHFKPYDDFIEPPLIREEIQKLKPARNAYITVYLPAYHPAKLARTFEKFPQVDWHVFSPGCSKSQQLGNVWVQPVSHQSFLQSVEGCTGVVASAGFELCSEAMFLNKKLLAIPIRNQYEQLCNAAALQKIGVKIIESLEGKENEIWQWLESDTIIGLAKIADPSRIVADIFNKKVRVFSSCSSCPSIFPWLRP